MDREKLRSQLRAQLGADAGVLETREGLVSGSVVFVGAADAAAMDRAVRLITRALESDAFGAMVAASAPAIAACRPTRLRWRPRVRLPPGRLDPAAHRDQHQPGWAAGQPGAGAGGHLELLTVWRRRCRSSRRQPSILPDWARASSTASATSGPVRGATSPLGTIAIVDDDPQGQYLYPEFLLYRRLFERAGWRVLIVDPAELDERGSCGSGRADRPRLQPADRLLLRRGASRGAAARL